MSDDFFGNFFSSLFGGGTAAPEQPQEDPMQRVVAASPGGIEGWKPNQQYRIEWDPIDMRRPNFIPIEPTVVNDTKRALAPRVLLPATASTVRAPAGVASVDGRALPSGEELASNVATPAGSGVLHGKYLDAIKKQEGFVPKAAWDYAQHTNGYGTKAKHASEVIDKVEAESRFSSEIGKAAALVDGFKSGLDAGTRAALTSLTFNSGTKWMKSGLGASIQAGDLAAARSSFVQYNKAGGSELTGLTNRRRLEVSWFGQQE